jgi:phosphoribosyl 1,2-cyclic phosphate phosphodiesterase
MRLHFLGTGTSFGIPVIGCQCPTCRSPDERDKRSRHAALLEADGRRLPIDTPPEIRLQLIRAGVPSVDAVWYTHYHADHVHGVDDLRVFSVRNRRPLEVYAAEETATVLASKFAYVFDSAVKPTAGTTRPEAELSLLRPFEPVTIAGFDLIPIAVPHGPLDVYGFRIGDLGYITDAKRLPAAAREALAGVRVLVLNALWFGNPHPTHLNVEEAVEAALQIGAERTFLTHLSHQVSHQELLDRLPAGILPAFDGLHVDF